MKHCFLTIIFTLMASAFAFGQGFGYVDTEKILKSVPEYETAQKELDALAEKYKTTIENEAAELDADFRYYQQHKNSYNNSQRQNIEDDIIAREKTLQDKQDLYFGEEGIMAKRTKDALSPIQAKIQQAIDKVALLHGAAIIVDLAVMGGVVYKNPEYDYTEEVIKMLK